MLSHPTILMRSFAVLMLFLALFLGSNGNYQPVLPIMTFVNVKLASMIKILKLQETQKHYSGTYDRFLLSTKTSGWMVCKEYAASIWIKNNNWAPAWQTYFRFANDPTYLLQIILKKTAYFL